MKVLMFGWEFPPHISGGLGTACYGLTQALMKLNVKVLFVVPRLHEGNSARDSYLINASAVTQKPKRRFRKKPGTASRNRNPASGHSTLNDRNRYTMVERHDMTFIEVPAGLTPYSNPVRGMIANRSVALQAWNYALHSEGTSSHFVQESIDAEETGASDDVFTFSGTYGPNLMTEVDKYAEVARVIAREHPFDVIHAHDWMTFPAGIAVKHQTKKPLIIHVHSTEFDRAGDHGNNTVREIEARAFREADLIIAVSNWTKQIITSKYNVPEKKVVVVHNGIMPKEQSEPYSFPSIGSHFVTFLGRVTHQKGPGFFVEAAQKVLQEFPDAHFIVAGAGDLLPQTIERVAQLNMSASFHFTGFLTPAQVDQIWALTNVYVMPSVSEPFGIAPLEAIQGGVPVILSKQSGVSEVMPHAIKVDFWDTGALAAAICSVLRYESLSNVLRHYSKQHIERLTWDKAANDVKAIYYEVTGTA